MQIFLHLDERLLIQVIERHTLPAEESGKVFGHSRWQPQDFLQKIRVHGGDDLLDLLSHCLGRLHVLLDVFEKSLAEIR